MRTAGEPVSAVGSSAPGSKGKVLVVDDEPLVLRAVATILRRAGYRFTLADTVAEARNVLERSVDEQPDVILTDLHLPDSTGLELLVEAKRLLPTAVTIVMTARATISSAVEAMRSGAYDYLVKPFEDNGILLSAVERALGHKRLLERNHYLETRLGEFELFEDLVGSSTSMRHLASMVETIGPTEASVLVSGESGTGKELVVRALHRRSKRRDKVLFAINCGALAETVLESELFGHVRGAFTGAQANRKGIFEAAGGSTVFLDEVGELPPSAQVRLLRVLQEREVKPLGSNETRLVDVRVIAATNRILGDEVAAGRFRQDLFYRLNVVAIEVPPLRNRLDDIPLLAHHFLRKYASRHERPMTTIEPEALALLAASDWPGNVRELENAIERAVVLSRGESLSAAQLAGLVTTTASLPSSLTLTSPLAPLAEAKQSFERSYVRRLMLQADGKLSDAARIAGLDPSNLRRLLRRFEAESNDPDAPASSVEVTSRRSK